MPLYTTTNIPYPEYRALSDLRRAHPEVHTGVLRAMIVFGGLVAEGSPPDINLLEVVEGYEGPRYVGFGNSPNLPLRGQMHLYFLTPEEFERPSKADLPDTSWSSAELLSQVRQAYAILLEEPGNYASDVMARIDNAPAFGARVTSQ